MPGWPVARTLIFFAALSWFCLGLHESIHHAAGRIACGAWGTMTLSTFALADTCRSGSAGWIAALAGPALTWSLIYLGVALRSPLGLTLVFANLPLARAITVAMRGGDEMVIGRAWFGGLAWPAMLAITLALLVVPVVLGWRSLPPRQRGWALPALLVLPILWDFAFKRMVFGALLPTEPMWNGVPLAILASYAVALAILLTTWPRAVAERDLELARA